jgi:hypothetical protein
MQGIQFIQFCNQNNHTIRFDFDHCCEDRPNQNPSTDLNISRTKSRTGWLTTTTTASELPDKSEMNVLCTASRPSCQMFDAQVLQEANRPVEKSVSTFFMYFRSRHSENQGKWWTMQCLWDPKERRIRHNALFHRM